MIEKLRQILKKGSLSISPKVFVFIFLAVALLVIFSAAVELTQSKKEMYDLMAGQSNTLLKTVLDASDNALKTKNSFELELQKRLLTNAFYVKQFYQQNLISNRKLRDFSNQQKLLCINIFDRRGERVFTSCFENDSLHTDTEKTKKMLAPILTGEKDTLILGIREAPYEPVYRYAVAVVAHNGYAIVINTDAEELFALRDEIGFGVLLNNVVEKNEIIYAALQDSNGILVAAGDIPHLDAVRESGFLKKSINDREMQWRIADYDTLEVFEAVEAFYHNGEFKGLFRIGLSLEPVEQINERIYRRVIIISIILILFGSLLLGFVFLRQNFSLLNKQYSAVEAFSDRVIQSVSDGIVVLDAKNNIAMMNPAAEEICDNKKTEVVGKPLSFFVGNDIVQDIIEGNNSLLRFNCIVEGSTKNLLISRAEFTDEHNDRNIVLVLKDLTEMQRLEQQIQRNERLSAMGELASGVAHEIRNPLNTIGTIVQQIKKDFEPKDFADDYHNLLALVYKEVKRINQTVEHFLRFARPETLSPEEINIPDFFHQLANQYEQSLRENSIGLNLNINYDGIVFWDFNKMKQVFINLFENAIDAVDGEGKISIDVENRSGEISITFSDSGKGIEPETIKKIFNLYYTTKAKGTGIGLSIVQRIIYDHGGVISVDSEAGRGAAFFISLPARFNDRKDN